MGSTSRFIKSMNSTPTSTIIEFEAYNRSHPDYLHVANLEFLEEGIFEDLFNKAKKIWVTFTKSVIAAIEGLNFGESMEIPVKMSSILKEGSHDKTIDLTSRIGYYHEFRTMHELSNLLIKEGVRVITDPAKIEQYSINYLQEKILDLIDQFKQKPDEVKDEIQRVNDAAKIVARKIYEDLKDSTDLVLCEVDIIHTGTSSLGKSKEDIRVVVRKLSTDEVIHEINASLKIYGKKKSINVFNGTMGGYINGILFEKNPDLKNDNIFSEMAKRHPKFTKSLAKLKKTRELWNETYRTQGRQAATEIMNRSKSFIAIRNILFQEMFDYFYKKDKKGINRRLMSSLGLDDSEDIYVIVGTNINNMKVISSRSSKKFKKLYETLKSDFKFKYVFPESTKTVSPQLQIISGKETIATFQMSIKEAGGFTHSFNMAGFFEEVYGTGKEKKPEKEKPAKKKTTKKKG